MKRTSRRLARMGRYKRHAAAATISLVALMDMFTNLVFFLLVSQGATEIKPPKQDIKLPDSYVEEKPRPTLVVMVSDTYVLVDGNPTATIADFVAAKEDVVPAVREKLREIKAKEIGLTEETRERSDEVTILAHKTIPFKVLKKLMSTCASAGYSKISLGVNQKAANS